MYGNAKDKTYSCVIVTQSQFLSQPGIIPRGLFTRNANAFPGFNLSLHYRKFLFLILTRTAPFASYLDSERKCKIGIDTTDISLEADSSAKGPFSTCSMQKKNGLNLKMKGASYSSVISGIVLGFSCHPKTVSYNTSLCNSMISTYQMLKKVKELR